MINIRSHLNTIYSDVDQFLATTLEQFWENLNPQGCNSEAKQNSLIYNAKSLLDEIKTGNYKETNGMLRTDRHVAFIDYLLEGENLKKIITSPPILFEEIINEVNEILKKEDFIVTKGGKSESSTFSKLLLQRIFKYKAYRGSKYCFDLYVSMGFSELSCPYCNEHFIKISYNEADTTDQSKLIFDIDHFYSKFSYPYLSLSFYNHIPSCKYCNQTYKGTKEFSHKTHLHPFTNSFDTSYSFQFSHKLLREGDVKLISIKQHTSTQEDLCKDLEILSRYTNNINAARLIRLREILAPYADILASNDDYDSEFIERLRERLTDFGLVTDGNKILHNQFSKFQRDLVKMFDVYNKLNITPPK